MSKHTPGPWHLDETFVDGQWGNPSRWVCEIVGPDNSRIVADIPEYRTYEEETAELEANARLIAAAPDYHEAVQAIFEACESNAAPVNLMAALRELDRQGKRISLDADLLIALFEAHAKATGEA